MGKNTTGLTLVARTSPRQNRLRLLDRRRDISLEQIVVSLSLNRNPVCDLVVLRFRHDAALRVHEVH